MNALTLNLRPVLELTDDRVYELYQENRDLKLERTAKGELIIMPPTGGKTQTLLENLQAWELYE